MEGFVELHIPKGTLRAKEDFTSQDVYEELPSL